MMRYRSPEIRIHRILHFTFYILHFLLLACSCEKSSTEPPPLPPPTKPDTTSHNFTWTTYSFGDGNASILKDVCIINENDIWAVGEIHVLDSSGRYNPHNAVHWDGQKWELKKIPVKIFNTNSFIISTLQSVFAFAPNDVWTTDGGEVIRFNGQSWGEWKFLFDDLNDTTFGGIRQFWGSSNTDLWGVGKKGNIFYYDGINWQRIESGTHTNINDIWGVLDRATGQTTILAVVSDRYYVGEYRLLSIALNGIADTLNWTLSRRLHSTWFDINSPIFVSGSGLRVWKVDQWEEILIPNYFSTRVRGSALNNIFVVGAFGLCVHYNGSSWQTYEDLMMATGSFEGLAVSDNLMVTVGYVDNHDVLVMGRRN